LIAEPVISSPETELSNQEVDLRGHKGAERRCVGTGETLDKTEMIRFVMGPDGALVPDIAGKLPGRGVWTRADKTALEEAIKNGGFKRGLKTNVKVSDDLVELTEDLLKRKILSLLPMALRAGQAYLGFDQVKSAAQKEPLSWRIEASNGAEGGRGKIRVLTRAVSLELGQRPAPVIGCFTSAELGKAFGREDLVHGAIKSGPMRKSFDQAARRLAGFCPLVPENWPDKGHEQTDNYAQKPGDKG